MVHYMKAHGFSDRQIGEAGRWHSTSRSWELAKNWPEERIASVLKRYTRIDMLRQEIDTAKRKKPPEA